MLAAVTNGSFHGTENDPVNFVGVDQSPYAVAKTLVIWEMLKQTPFDSKSGEGDDETPTNSNDEAILSHVRKIAQAWFSATWDEGTRECVLAALHRLEQSKDTKVQELLDHWSKAPICPLARSHLDRADAGDREGRQASVASHLVRETDRIAMLKYELTGGFCLSNNDPVCSNTLMFDNHHTCPPVASSESVFTAFPIDTLIANMRQRKHTDMSILNAAETYALDGLVQLSKIVYDRKVDLELHCSQIQDIVPNISSLKPRSMSWSNVCDYIIYPDFHLLAQACSDEDRTLHFGYSMNWTTEVYGASIMGFPGPENLSYRIDVLEKSLDKVKLKYKLHEWNEYLRCPPPYAAETTVSQYCLYWIHVDRWAEFFFACASTHALDCDVKEVEYGVHTSPLSNTGPSTVGFSWTY